MLQLPESFLQEMRELLGDEYDAWEKSYEYNEGFRGLRVNTGKLRPEEFQALSAFSLRAVPWTRNGFYLEEQAQASKHPYYAAGLYYLQEPSAMTPAACLPIEEGDGYWISAQPPAERPRSWRQSCVERAFWLPMTSAIPGQKPCLKIWSSLAPAIFS